MAALLFPDLPQDFTFRAEHGAAWTSGAWQHRNWHGYWQSKERGGNWRFYITGFTGPEDGDGTAYVMKLDAHGRDVSEPHPINGRGHVLILGRRYGRQNWDH